MLRTIAPAFVSLSLVTALAAGQAVETRGVIDAVTVYRGQALVTRAVPVAAAKAADGVREIIVTDLPPRIVPASLHAEGADGLQVRSVRYRERPVSQDVREEVRQADAAIASIEARLATNKRNRELMNETAAYVTSLQGFVAPTAQAELTRGVLNADQLEKLSAYILDQRQKIAKTDLDLAAEEKSLRESLDLARREREKLTQGSSRTVREAVVFVAGDARAPGQFRLRYVVEGATWTPSYNARAEGAGERSGVRLEYFASIQQMSGEDWGSVTMSLSTATPSLSATAPTLSAMAVSLGAPAQDSLAIDYAQTRLDLFRKQREVAEQRQNIVALVRPGDAGRGGGGELQDKALDQALNRSAADVQMLDLLVNEKVTRDNNDRLQSREDGVSVSYVIAGRTSLPSRTDRQLVQIADLTLPAAFTKTAAPVLTTAVYDEATCSNTGTLVLLRGPVTAYLDGAFVGVGDLPTVAVGQGFTLGFGADTSLKASRELLERNESIQGGNRVVELTYRLSVENFGANPAQVRLVDRLPKSSDKQIKVTMVAGDASLSRDDEYLRTQRKDGILRWDIAAPPRSSGASATTVEYTFRLEYDKQMSLVGMGS